MTGEPPPRPSRARATAAARAPRPRPRRVHALTTASAAPFALRSVTTFSLDFCRPISALAAFGIAMTGFYGASQ